MPKFLLNALLFCYFTAASQVDLINNQPSNNAGIVKITFINVVKKEPMVLGEVKYINPFGETYSINKFKYYISNVAMQTSSGYISEKESCYLINQVDSASLSFSFPLPAGTYNSLSFLLGVDSLHNVSGAQTDALDPVNDMFWTWNSGYVMAKMEGASSASSFNNVFEFHIGGFAGVNNVLKNIKLKLVPQPLLITENKTSEIIIECDANTWWQKPNDIKISAHPNISSPGLLAKKVSDNYIKMFKVKEIINN